MQETLDISKFAAMIGSKMSKWAEQQRGAFWKKEGKNGKYLAGYVTIEGKKYPVTVFPNQYKEKENQPEFIIYETFAK